MSSPSGSHAVSKQAPPNASSSTANAENNLSPTTMIYTSRSGQDFKFDISRKACEPFGFYFGDRVRTAKKKKTGWVIGVWTSPETGRPDLWFHIDGESGASRWEGFEKRDFEQTGFELLYRPGAEVHEEVKERYRAMDLRKLLSEEDDTFADVTFKLGSARIKAHKAILCARSEYFRAMFKCGMKESTQSEVEIKMDVDETSFRGVLEFLYTGDVDMVQHNVIMLLVTASKFQLDSLCQLCYHYLDSHNQLSCDNVIELIQLAREYHLPDLRAKCLQFILENYEILKKEHKFDILMDTDKETMLEIMENLEPKRKTAADNRNRTSLSGTSSSHASPMAKKRKII